MRVIDTGVESATLEVTAADCFRLSQACEMAAATAQGCYVDLSKVNHNRDDLAVLWEVMASLFDALGAAAAAPSYMRDSSEYTLQGVKQSRLAELGDQAEESEQTA